MRTEPLAAHDPTSVGPWQLVGRIGAGGMGVVYLGRRTSGGRTHLAAIKLISSEFGGRDTAVSRFRREIAVLMSVDDPGVARVLAADIAEDPPWYAADLVDGPTLASHVRDQGPVSPDLWPSLALSLAATLTRLHDRRIIHRDLKPQNVVIGPSGPVIIDFGISAVLGSTSLTATGASPRTELWASPEQLRNEDASAATDIFALGTLLAWSGSGQHPFAAPTDPHRDGVYSAVLSSPPTLDGLPPEDLRWLAPMLAKDPGERPTAVDVVESILDVTPELAAVRARRAQACGWSAAARSWWQVVADAEGAVGADGARSAEAYLELGRLAAADGDARGARTWWLLAEAAGHPEAAPLLAGPAPGARSTSRPQTSLPNQSEPTLAMGELPRADPGPPDGSDASPTPSPVPPRAPGHRRPRRVLAYSAGTVLVIVLAWITATVTGWPPQSTPAADSAASYSTRPVRVALAAEDQDPERLRIAVGDTSACVITAQGVARCWGSNASGQLGSPGGDSAVPRDVDTSGVLEGVTLERIVIGHEHACALDDAGRMYCWGSNSHGQLGVGTPGVNASATPMRVGGPEVRGRELSLIGAAGASSCALDAEGLLLCWGDNDTGQVGDASRTSRATPVPVDTTGVLRGKRINRFGVGGDHTCAIDTQDWLYCWGSNDRGQLGNGSLTTSLVPRLVGSTEWAAQGQYVSVNLGEDVTCGRMTSGGAACWGANDHGQLGTGSAKQDASLPQPVAAAVDALPFDRLAVSGPTVCSISTQGIVYCWGDNSSGQLGSGTTQDESIPVAVTDPVEGPLPTFVRVAAGPTASCAVGDDGSAWCWGSDENGLLGNR